ncbi:MAG: hypothetical protein AB8F95_02235 [Bacteroidia bacterium]
MKPSVVIAATKPSTFINAHASLLPAETFLIHGASFPTKDHEGNYFSFKNNVLQKLESGLNRIGLPGLYFRKRGLEKYL